MTGAGKREERMETWDLYTADRRLTDKEHVRGDEIPEGYYHLVVHVWIRNAKGEYLISQRAANRPTFPLMWECVGGSVVKGENSLEAAIREVKEEVGIDLPAHGGTRLFSEVRQVVGGKKFNDILDVWLFQYDGEVHLANATTDEVAQIKWLSRDQIQKLADGNLLVGTLDYFFAKVPSE